MARPAAGAVTLEGTPVPWTAPGVASRDASVRPGTFTWTAAALLSLFAVGVAFESGSPRALFAAILITVASLAFLFAPWPTLVALIGVRPSLDLWADGTMTTVGGLKLSLNTLLTIFLVVVGLPYLAQRWATVRKAPAAFPFLALSLFAGVSVFSATAFGVAASEWLRLASIAAGYGLVYSLVDSRKRVEATAAAALLSVAPSALAGVHQMLAEKSETHSGPFQFIRANGGFPQPDAFGIFVSLGLAVGVTLVLSRRLRWRIPLMAGLGIGAAALVGSYTRTAWIALVVGLLVAGALRHRLLIILVPVVVVAVALAVPSVSTRFADLSQSSTATSRQNTLDARIGIWRSELPKITQAPLRGHGLQSVYLGRTQLVHNDYLRMAVETGLGGFAAFVWLVVAGVRGSFEAVRRTVPRGESLLIAASVGGAAVSVMYLVASVGLNLATKVSIAGLAWTIIATGHAAGRLAAPRRRRSYSAERRAFTASPLDVLTAFLARVRRSRAVVALTRVSFRRTSTAHTTGSAESMPVARRPQPTGVGAGSNAASMPVQGKGAHRSDLLRLARGGTLNIAGGVANGVLGFGFAVVVARAMGVAEAGVFFQVVALEAIVATLAQLGASPGLVRMISRDLALGRAADIRPTLRIALVPVLVFGTGLGAILAATAPWSADVISSGALYDDTVVALVVIAPFVLIDALLVPVLRACQGFGSMVPVVAIYNVGVPLARFALGVPALLVGGSLLWLLLAWALPLVVGLALAIPWLFRFTRTGIKDESSAPARPSREIARDFWSYTSYQAFAAIVQIILLRLDVLLLGAMRTSREAAIYAGASRYLTAGTMILNAIVFVIGPQVSGMLARGDTGRARVVYQVATIWLSALAFPVFIGLAVFSPVFMQVFGAEFTAGSTALTILSLAMLVNIGTGAVRAVLSMGGKSSWLLFDNTVALVVDVVLNFVLIPPLGMEGAAIAWAFAIAAGNLVPLFQVWRLWRLQPVTVEAIVVVASAGIAYGLGGLLLRVALGATLQALVLSILLGTALYGTVLWQRRAGLHAEILRDAFAVRRRRPSISEGG
jgi:O-antigen/teichoic acid export membrane protein/O-antigen ligase